MHEVEMAELDELLNIEPLMADTVTNYQRHQRMMQLWIAAKRLRREKQFELADRLRWAGNRLHGRNTPQRGRP